MAGGGGFGDPSKRNPERVALDVRNGLVTKKSAETDYLVKLLTDGSVDLEGTRAMRNGFREETGSSVKDPVS
jgi:N-methylhydantoinase B